MGAELVRIGTALAPRIVLGRSLLTRSVVVPRASLLNLLGATCLTPDRLYGLIRDRMLPIPLTVLSRTSVYLCVVLCLPFRWLGVILVTNCGPNRSTVLRVFWRFLRVKPINV